MHYKNKIARIAIFALALIIIFAGCKKLSRPTLGDYPKDANPPGGPLKFYVAFDGATNNPLMNGVDSIKADFPSVNPFTVIDGIRGKAAKGVSQKALLYPAANDFNKSTSFTISFWEKNSVPTGGSPQFVFSLASKDYWHQSDMFLLVDHDGAGSTVDSAAVSFVLQDNWFVTHDKEKLPGHLLNGQWHHIAITYDEKTSRVNYFVDGTKAIISDSNSVWGWKGPLHGPVHFADDYGFVLGGWNKHANLGNGAPTDDWIQSWQGGLDQFRLYNYAMSQSDVQALYNGKE